MDAGVILFYEKQYLMILNYLYAYINTETFIVDRRLMLKV